MPCSTKQEQRPPHEVLRQFDDVGAAAAFLAHDAARLITGKMLHVDDGYRIIDQTAESAQSTSRPTTLAT